MGAKHGAAPDYVNGGVGSHHEVVAPGYGQGFFESNLCKGPLAARKRFPLSDEENAPEGLARSVRHADARAAFEGACFARNAQEGKFGIESIGWNDRTGCGDERARSDFACREGVEVEGNAMACECCFRCVP